MSIHQNHRQRIILHPSSPFFTSSPSSHLSQSFSTNPLPRVLQIKYRKSTARFQIVDSTYSFAHLLQDCIAHWKLEEEEINYVFSDSENTVFPQSAFCLPFLNQSPDLVIQLKKKSKSVKSKKPKETNTSINKEDIKLKETKEKQTKEIETNEIETKNTFLDEGESFQSVFKGVIEAETVNQNPFEDKEEFSSIGFNKLKERLLDFQSSSYIFAKIRESGTHFNSEYDMRDLLNEFVQVYMA